MPDLKKMTSHEKQAIEELRQWRLRGPGLVEGMVDTINKPMEFIFTKMAPHRVQEMEMAILRWALEIFNSAASRTYSMKRIFREFQKSGANVSSPGDVRKLSMKTMDEVAGKQYTVNAIVTALEGFGTGMGGISLMAVDIPAVFTVNFRLFQQVGTCYGYDMKAGKEVEFLLCLMNLTSARATEKTAAFKLIVESLDRLVRKAGEQVAVFQSIKKLCSGLGVQVSERQLTKVVPILGSFFSSGFNYWFISENMVNAINAFRERRLKERYGVETVNRMLGNSS